MHALACHTRGRAVVSSARHTHPLHPPTHSFAAPSAQSHLLARAGAAALLALPGAAADTTQSPLELFGVADRLAAKFVPGGQRLSKAEQAEMMAAYKAAAAMGHRPSIDRLAQLSAKVRATLPCRRRAARALPACCPRAVRDCAPSMASPTPMCWPCLCSIHARPRCSRVRSICLADVSVPLRRANLPTARACWPCVHPNGCKPLLVLTAR